MEGVPPPAAPGGPRVGIKVLAVPVTSRIVLKRAPDGE